MRALANKKNSFIIVCSLKKLQELKDWKIITQQEFNNKHCLTLMKKVNLQLVFNIRQLSYIFFR